ncbi:hypothetical protein M404DRAFT_29356 [Pisolithus tinctorius Marx 270]|uniref:Uncharacterized protein n=1 Tax=Pisolithus tinctorius Marx 270 TaxID=870435 RepID=A0A0C3NZG3_PISTI|nr:hypothetical protein M404DRAFT_29356 [Pisolithus tinctorius Marx 270]
MDELVAARAELVRLEENERNLVKQLSDVRTAAAKQRKRIEELIRTRPPPIQCLPVELLSSILLLALRGTNPSQKEILARVSRHWRDVILDHPNFWSAIEIVSSRKLSPAVRLHLKKSREAPLDITIRVESSKHHSSLREGLDLLIPCADRWHTLYIYSWSSASFPQFILGRIGAVKFPSLKRIEFDWSVDTFPTFLSATNVPVLEHLDLGYLMVDDRDGRSWHRSMPGMSFSTHIPVLTLVTLTLSGHTPPWLLQPNSVHFPVLETLKISLTSTSEFFKAIVTPKLISLDYAVSLEDIISSLFSSLEGKFSSVKQVSFTMESSSLDTSGALALCRVFPNVCHAEFYSESLPHAFFDPCEGIYSLRSPVDHWKSLESVAFRDMDPSLWLEPPIRENNAFVRWLVERQHQQPLRVRIEGAYAEEEDVPSFCMLYEILREYCVVELEDVVLCHESELSKSAGSRLQLVGGSPSSIVHFLTSVMQCVPMFTSGLVDDMGAVVGEQSSHE